MALTPYGQSLKDSFYDRGMFTQLVAWPTLAPQLVPDSEKENFNAQMGREKDGLLTIPSCASPLGGSAIANSGAVALASEADAEVQDIFPDDKEHLVYVTMAFTELVQDGSHKSAKAKIKKANFTKTKRIDMLNISRSNFIVAFMALHSIDDKFTPSSDKGPGFKLWFTGTSGGKSGAATIDTNEEFNVLLQALFKRTTYVNVNVLFDINTWESFRKRKRAIALEFSDDTEAELCHGTKVPRVDLYSEATQLNGTFILQLKEKWTCQTHLGEHREPGFCYVTPTGEHVGLNHRRLAMWASAMAAGEATKYEPPNIAEFDGAANETASSLLLAAVIPLLTNLTRPAIPTTPVRPRVVSTPGTPTKSKAARASLAPDSPAPAAGEELRQFLVDLQRVKSVDIQAKEAALAALDITPDIIPDIPVSRICELVGVTEGVGFKVQKFCRAWNACLEEKRVY
ncbi:hypothetical protein BD410DRAFT_846335 [Rickenella mellea]|uniref:Uncharacterized protein n=1 Tax=Rickenella mellea TaxID=50990 RepID=A0A4Y7PFL5_9AGAM|nr:hypothetical protein BD410DRAFT_846335 [Rickenella mellea]